MRRCRISSAPAAARITNPPCSVGDNGADIVHIHVRLDDDHGRSSPAENAIEPGSYDAALRCGSLCTEVDDDSEGLKNVAQVVVSVCVIRCGESASYREDATDVSRDSVDALMG